MPRNAGWLLHQIAVITDQKNKVISVYCTEGQCGNCARGWVCEHSCHRAAAPTTEEE